MTVILNPYGRGREWAAGKGPAAKLDCAEAIEDFGWSLGAKESSQFLSGVEAYQDEQGLLDPEYDEDCE